MDSYNKGYQQCLEDIKTQFKSLTDDMEGEDFIYMLRHNINPDLFEKEWTPELIATCLVFRQ